VSISIHDADIKAKAFLCVPYQFSDICLVYPKTTEEVITSYSNYSYELNILTMDEFDIQYINKQKGIKLAIENIHPLQYLIQSTEYDYKILKDVRTAFESFIHETITILPSYNQVIIGDFSEKRIIDESNFIYFQNILRLQNNLTPKEIPPDNESERDREARLKRALRDMIKKQKGKLGSSKDEPLELVSVLSSLCVYSGYSISEINKMSFYAVKILFARYQLKEKFDQDFSAIVNGADSKKIKMKPWKENITD
jgi:hypothetical protein